jgi:hypothetical protein
MKVNSKRPNGVVMAVFSIPSGWTVIWLYAHHVDLGEDGTPEKLVGVIVNMTDGVEVWDCPGVECPVVAARAPTVVFLGYDV